MWRVLPEDLFHSHPTQTLQRTVGTAAWAQSRYNVSTFREDSQQCNEVTILFPKTQARKSPSCHGDNVPVLTINDTGNTCT